MRVTCKPREFCPFCHSLSVRGRSPEYWWSLPDCFLLSPSCLFNKPLGFFFFYIKKIRCPWTPLTFPWLTELRVCLIFQMKVGLEAAESIRKVHGKNYTVGSSPDVLCTYIHPRWSQPTADSASLFVFTIKEKKQPANPFFRPQLRLIQRLGSVAGDPLHLHLWAERRGNVWLRASWGSNSADLRGGLQWSSAHHHLRPR